MNDLTVTTPEHLIPLVSQSGDHFITTSLIVAQAFGKRPADVIRAIERLHCSEVFRQFNFALTSNLVSMPRGGTRLEPVYEITRDGFAYLCMGFTGEKAGQWKEGFIAAFNRMESQLKAGDAKALSRTQAELTRTQRQLIAAQRSLLSQARRQVRQLAMLPQPDVRQGELFTGRA